MLKLNNVEVIYLGVVRVLYGISMQVEDGSVVGFECSVNFHAVYGLSLSVYIADPSITLGEMELKKREIIEYCWTT